MYAHMTTIPAAVDRLDQGSRAFQEQIVPLLQDQAEFRSVCLLVDRSRGTVVLLSVWESQTALRQSEQSVGQRRAALVQQLGGTTPTVERYDVAFIDGRGAGRYARATIESSTAATLKDGLRYVRQQRLPTLRSGSGFGGLVQLVNRRSGTLLGVAFFESAEALRQATELAGRMRIGVERAGIRGPDTAAAYEVVLPDALA